MGLLCKLFGHKWQDCRCLRCREKRDIGHYFKNAVGAPGKICRYCGTKNPNYEKDCKDYNSWLIGLGVIPADFTCVKCRARVPWHRGKGSECPQCGMTYNVYNGHRTYKADNGSNPYFKEILCAVCGKGYASNAGDTTYDSLSNSDCK